MEKKKNKKNIFYNMIIVILIGIIGFSLFNIGKILWGYYSGTKEYKKVEQLAGIADDIPTDIDFKKLKEQNEDVRGWIFLKDSPINYPIVQGKDNDYYLYRMFNKDYNTKGSIFLDYRSNGNFEDFNTVIYGHRMKDGSMFHDLIEYRDEDYYNKHKTMILITPEAKYDVEVFGVVTIPADSPQYKFSFNESEKQSYINWIEANTETKTDVKVTSEDKIIMLSTCTYEYDDARLVVYGKLVPKN